MNENTNDEVENNNSMGAQESAGEKIDQTKKMDKSLIRKYGLIKGEIIPFCKKV